MKKKVPLRPRDPDTGKILPIGKGRPHRIYLTDEEMNIIKKMRKERGEPLITTTTKKKKEIVKISGYTLKGRNLGEFKKIVRIAARLNLDEDFVKSRLKRVFKVYKEYLTDDQFGGKEDEIISHAVQLLRMDISRIMDNHE